MTPDDLLRTPGEILVEAREKAGLSLPDLAERTKIPPRMLEAIERDEYHRVSDPLYVRSFLRAYAVEVGLDPDEIMDLYARSTGSGVTAAPESEGVWEEQAVTINRVGLPWGRIVPVAAGVVLAVLVLVFAIRGCGGDEGGEPSGSPAITAGAAQRESLFATEAAPQTDTTTVADATEPVVADEPGGETPATAAPDPQPQTASPAPPEPQVTPPARELPRALTGDPSLNMAGPYRGDLVLRVVATAPTQVRVRRDGEHVYRSVDLAGTGGDEEVLPLRGIVPGRAYAVREGSVVYWRARDHFSLKLDRVAGVSVEVNGRPRDLSRLRSGQEMILDSHAAE